MSKFLFLLLISSLILSLTSCETVNKLFHKTKSQIDSTSVTHQRKDSTVTIDSFAVRKSRTESNNEIVFDFGDKKMNIPIKDDSIDTGIYYYPNTDDFFEISPSGIRTNMPLKKVTIKGKTLADSFDSLSKHSQIQLSDVKDDSTHLSKKEKEVVKEVRKKRTFLWWLLLVIPAYLIYRNWPKIRSVLIHLFTGL